LSKRRFVIRTLLRWLRSRPRSSLTPSRNGIPRVTNKRQVLQKSRRLRPKTTPVRSRKVITTVTGTCPKSVRRLMPLRGRNPSSSFAGFGAYKLATYRFEDGCRGYRPVHSPSPPQRSQPKCPRLKITIRARFIIYIIEDSRPDAASLKRRPQMGHCAGALCRDLISRPSCPVLLAAAVFSATKSGPTARATPLPKLL
jgi:hypothetical protein